MHYMVMLLTNPHTIRGRPTPGGGPRLSEISCTYDPPIYDITSGCRVAALFSREAQRWTPDAIWFPRYFYPQANGIMYLECREY